MVGQHPRPAPHAAGDAAGYGSSVPGPAAPRPSGLPPPAQRCVHSSLSCRGLGGRGTQAGEVLLCCVPLLLASRACSKAREACFLAQCPRLQANVVLGCEGHEPGLMRALQAAAALLTPNSCLHTTGSPLLPTVTKVEGQNKEKALHTEAGSLHLASHGTACCRLPSATYPAGC